MAIRFTAALICGQIMRALRQPAVLGELLGGMFLGGPTVLGTLAPHAYSWLFPATGTITVGRDAMLKIGILFFMCVAGLEVNPIHLACCRKREATNLDTQAGQT